MAKRHGALSSTKKRARPSKTKKRLAIKNLMLAARAAKKKR